MSERKMVDIGDDKLRDMFEESFDEQIGKFTSMGDCEAKILRNASDGEVSVEVLVTGMAGSPTVDQFKAGSIEETTSLKVELDGYETMQFTLAPEKTVGLNSNDFNIVYELEV
jgi:hypothetical protein